MNEHCRGEARAGGPRLALLALTLAALPPTLHATNPAAGATAGHVVEGWVEDETGRLPGASVQLVELRRRTVTNAEGAFRFESVPAGRFTLGVHLEGFASAHRPIVVPVEGPFAIQLDLDLRFEEEVTVTAAPWALRTLETAQQVDLVNVAEPRFQGIASVGEALSKVPGVANIPTGNGLGTPVIRGLSENRIRVLNDGVPLNHQQFSFRHSPNVEPGFAARIELVRGPASVLYGPDAMGGVINLVHAPLPTAAKGERTFHGELAPAYASNSDQWAGHVRFEGAAGGFGWRGQLVRRTAGDITTPQGSLDNTDFEQTNATVTAGHNGAWGNGTVRWHHWENATGLLRPAGFRLELEDDVFAADVHVPASFGAFELLAAHQQNIRKAFPAPLGGRAAVDLRLVTSTGRLGFQHSSWGPLRGRLAVEYLRTDNTPRALAVLLPDYESDNLAVMLYEEARLVTVSSGRYERLILSLGARWDSRHLEVGPEETRHLPSGWNRDFGAVTGALGAVLRLREDMSLAGSLGRGWRPPNAFELFAAGVHGGVAAIQLGNPELVEESNVNAELALRYEGRRVRGSVSVYRNAFDQYIYLADTGRVEGTAQGELPVFMYRQADASIEGFEAALDVAPLEWLKLALAYTLIDTRNEETGAALPQTPPDRLLARVLLKRGPWRHLSRAFVGLDVSFVGEGAISGPDEPFGTPTDAYTVADLTAGAEWALGGTSLGLDLTVRNLLDEEYTDFLWSYKAFAPNPGRDVRLAAHLRF